MNRPASLGMALGLVFAVCACSSSDHKGTSTTAGSGGGAAGKSSSAGSGGGISTAGSGTGPTGTGSTANGDSCNNTAQCMPGSKCVLSVALNDLVQICAQSCGDDSDCNSGESCVTETSKPADSHCIKQVDKAFAICGPSNTSLCTSPLDCIFSDLQTETVPVGYCYNYCLLPGSTLQTSDPTLLQQCPSGLTCLPLGDPDVGLCAHQAALGAACGLDSNQLCGGDDLCITTLSQMAVQDQLCYQDCTTDPTKCAAGSTCKSIQASDGSTTGYCMPM